MNKTMYAIINLPIEKAGVDAPDYETYITDSPIDLIAVFEKAGYDPTDHCIEIYTADEEGEFVEGSDYDTFENFKKRFGDVVAVYGMDLYVTLNNDDITEYKTDDLYYEQAYQLDDGRWIAFDEAVNAWVMLG